MNRRRGDLLIRFASCPRCRGGEVVQRAEAFSRGTHAIDGGLAEPPEILETDFTPCRMCGGTDLRPWTVAEEMHLITHAGLWVEEDFTRWQ